MLTLRRHTLLLITLLMVGCGWHLKGQVELPIGLRILNLEAAAVGFDTQKLLKQALLSNGVTLAQDAPYTLKILQDSAKKRTLAVKGNGKASEYELIQTLSFMVLDDQGIALTATIDATSYRTQLYDSEAVTGKAQEEQNLRRKMKRDNASKLLQRLQKVTLKRIETNRAP
jgi:LPS-assembly lipoprotein